jgi:ribosome-binding protein aMBF1 (putative translation factor)
MKVTIVASLVKSISRILHGAVKNSHPAICSQVARLLREEREKQNLSLKALAERAGLSRQMVGYVEQEARNPTLETLLRLSDALGIKLHELIARASKR